MVGNNQIGLYENGEFIPCNVDDEGSPVGRTSYRGSGSSHLAALMLSVKWAAKLTVESEGGVGEARGLKTGVLPSPGCWEA
jgi:hypothetical protein